MLRCLYSGLSFVYWGHLLAHPSLSIELQSKMAPYGRTPHLNVQMLCPPPPRPPQVPQSTRAGARKGGRKGLCGMLCVGMAPLSVALATPQCNSSSGGGDGEASAWPGTMQQRSKVLRSWALFDCPWGQTQGGGVKDFSHLEVWAPNVARRG